MSFLSSATVRFHDYRKFSNVLFGSLWVMACTSTVTYIVLATKYNSVELVSNIGIEIVEISHQPNPICEKPPSCFCEKMSDSHPRSDFISCNEKKVSGYCTDTNICCCGCTIPPLYTVGHFENIVSFENSTFSSKCDVNQECTDIRECKNEIVSDVKCYHTCIDYGYADINIIILDENTRIRHKINGAPCRIMSDMIDLDTICVLSPDMLLNGSYTHNGGIVNDLVINGYYNSKYSGREYDTYSEKNMQTLSSLNDIEYNNNESINVAKTILIILICVCTIIIIIIIVMMNWYSRNNIKVHTMLSTKTNQDSFVVKYRFYSESSMFRKLFMKKLNEDTSINVRRRLHEIFTREDLPGHDMIMISSLENNSIIVINPDETSNEMIYNELPF